MIIKKMLVPCDFSDEARQAYKFALEIATASKEELFVGSNIKKSVRNAPVPVFTVHQAMPVSKIKDIVFPTKLDLTQSRLIAKLKTLQAFFDATVHLLFIHSPDDTTIDKETIIATDNFAKFYQLDKYKVHVRRTPDIQQGILKFASEFEHCMIAMATEDHRGLIHLFVGSTAEVVTKHAYEPIRTLVSEHQDYD